MRTATLGASPGALPAVPVSVGVAVLTVAATVGPVIATDGPRDSSPAVHVPGGVVNLLSGRRAEIVAETRAEAEAQVADAIADLRHAQGRLALDCVTGETQAQVQNRVLPLGATINGVFVANNDTVVPTHPTVRTWQRR